MKTIELYAGTHSFSKVARSHGYDTFTTDYEGKTYFTTPGFLEAARQTWHELDQMPDVNPTFYGA